MKIIDMNITEYMDVLKTDAPAPGGGGVSGITAAQGISLTLMVLSLTLGKEKYKEYEEDNRKINEKCKEIYNELLEAADNDKEAFIKLSEAYKLPNGTEEQKAYKKKVIGDVSVGATEAPFRVMELAYDALVLTEKIVGKSNKMASSDLGVAAACLKSASLSAWLNVKINIPYLNDEKLKEKFSTEGIELIDKTEKLADDVYKRVEEAL